jgi:hypothetical protein
MRTPLYRGQGNRAFNTADARGAAKRGQTVPYDVNGAPTGSSIADGNYGDIIVSGLGKVWEFAGTVNNNDWSGADLSLENGGTGASTAAAARTNLSVNSVAENDLRYALTSHTHTIADITGLQSALDGKQPAGSYLTANQTITVTGDATGSGSTAIALTLATVNTNTGIFGGMATVPKISVDGKGRITSVEAVTISITKAQAGLPEVDNTKDIDKPVSTAQQTALDLKFDKSGGTVVGSFSVKGSATFAAFNMTTTATAATISSTNGAGDGYASMNFIAGPLLSLGASTGTGFTPVYGLRLSTTAVNALLDIQRAGNKVIGVRGAAVADAVPAVAAPTMAEFNALVTQFNTLLARLRSTTGHGLFT